MLCNTLNINSLQSLPRWFTPRGSAVRIRHRPRKEDNESCPLFFVIYFLQL
jgi:hypothetical protein